MRPMTRTYPSLFQINTRAWLTEMSREILAEFPESGPAPRPEYRFYM